MTGKIVIFLVSTIVGYNCGPVARIVDAASENDVVGPDGTLKYPSAFSATNFTYLYPELDDWEAPLEMKKNYPFYLTGFDDENRPIWVTEWGKYDLRRIVHSGPETMELYMKYCRKAVRVISKSHDFLSTKENPVYHANFIVDLDDMRLEQITDGPTFGFLLRLALEHRDIITLHANKVVVLNTNFIADTVVRFARTVFGGLFEKVQVFGTNKAKWIPELLRMFPQDSLPEWYGGLKGHKPLMVFG